MGAPWGTLLSCCRKVLGDGWHRWHHIQVLKPLADSICTAIQRSKTHVAPRESITFSGAGQKTKHQSNPSGGLLVTTWDRQLQGDLGRQLEFPVYKDSTSPRLDGMVASKFTKQVELLEVTLTGGRVRAMTGRPAVSQLKSIAVVWELEDRS